MKNIINEIDKLLSRIIGFLITYSILFFVIALLVAWTEITIQVLVALAFLLMSYVIAYLSYKLWIIKKLLGK